jgi:hypothetical protein
MLKKDKIVFSEITCDNVKKNFTEKVKVQQLVRNPLYLRVKIKGVVSLKTVSVRTSVEDRRKISLISGFGEEK